ncbi:hypothetical protein RRG08_032583 [Elysia crispata]|uniref:Uncharacterized protein n=1 Tax=Elysia crispata TaxID=231223 RepID=A0AAE1DPG8_9GAST|nr:hypothetical protein RRG08_032583 [Elysia crispata]
MPPSRQVHFEWPSWTNALWEVNNLLLAASTADQHRIITGWSSPRCHRGAGRKEKQEKPDLFSLSHWITQSPKIRLTRVESRPVLSPRSQSNRDSAAEFNYQIMALEPVDRGFLPLSPDNRRSTFSTGVSTSDTQILDLTGLSVSSVTYNMSNLLTFILLLSQMGSRKSCPCQEFLEKNLTMLSQKTSNYNKNRSSASLRTKHLALQRYVLITKFCSSRHETINTAAVGTNHSAL